MFGDQGFFERGTIFLFKNITCMKLYLGHNVSFSRSGEQDLIERLDGLVSVPQEWHKKKVKNEKILDIEL